MPPVLHDAQKRSAWRISTGKFQFVVVEDLVAILEIDEDAGVETLERELLVETAEEFRLCIPEDLAIVVRRYRAIPYRADLFVFHAARHRLRSRYTGVI